MKNILRKLKIFVVILIVLLLSLVAFVGVFTREKGIWSNIVSDYQFGKDISGMREIRYSLNDESEEKYVYVDEEGNIKGEVWKDGNSITQEDENQEDETEIDSEENSEEEISYEKETRTIQANSDENRNKENFEKAKRIIQERFKNQNIEDYNIRLDDVTGKLQIELANDDEKVDLAEELIEEQGKFKIVDYQNGIVLMDNSDIKNVSVLYSNSDSSYNTYLQIEFNKEGKEKLKNISNKYVETVAPKEDSEDIDNENEEVSEEDSEEKEIKYVSVVLDDTTMMTTYFGEEMASGILQIKAGQARTEYEDFRKDYESAKLIADILNSGILPIDYELETDNFVGAQLTENSLNNIKIIFAIIIVIISIILILKFKLNGFISAILGIGYIALLSLIIRYTNVIVTVNGLTALACMIAANYIFYGMILRKLDETIFSIAYLEVMKKFYLSVIPLIVIAIVFTFAKYTLVNSIGMIVFWALVLNAVYNFMFTRIVFKNKGDK